MMTESHLHQASGQPCFLLVSSSHAGFVPSSRSFFLLHCFFFPCALFTPIPQQVLLAVCGNYRNLLRPDVDMTINGFPPSLQQSSWLNSASGCELPAAALQEDSATTAKHK